MGNWCLIGMTEQVLKVLGKLDERNIQSIIWETLQQSKLIIYLALLVKHHKCVFLPANQQTRLLLKVYNIHVWLSMRLLHFQLLWLDKKMATKKITDQKSKLFITKKYSLNLEKLLAQT